VQTIPPSRLFRAFLVGVPGTEAVAVSMTPETTLSPVAVPSPGEGVTVEVPTTYRGLRLDPFQRRAMRAVLRGRNAIVAAPTGTGKTLIADFLVERELAAGHRVVYTAPIKALSNQKFEEYAQWCGPERVGILTGDVSIRPEAPLCIMTTEILRNQLISGDGRLDDVAWVIFDEIHYIASDRGIAWEESIILLPPGVRLLGLSATIGNLEALAAWVAQTLGRPVERIRQNRRAVPLSVQYATGAGVCSFRQARQQALRGNLDGTRMHHLQLVRTAAAEGGLPALYFVFSRLGTEERAREAAHTLQLLDADGTRAVQHALGELEAQYPGAHELQGPLRQCLERGVAYHHAGLLPATKRIVESLYARGLIPLLYCTETFAVGVNYPVRSVILESTRKFDGRGFRPLTAQEFQQMTGRAGRRGKDDRGFAFVGVDGRDREPPLDYAAAPLEPLRSQFFVTETSALNLLRSFGRERAVDVLARNFREFQRQQDLMAARQHLQALRAQREQLWAAGCPHLGTPACPLERERLLAERATLRARRRQQHHRRGRRGLDRALLAIDAQLAVAVDCPKDPSACTPLVAPFARLQAELTAAEAAVEPVDNARPYREELEQVLSLLQGLGYVGPDDQLLPRGEVARHLHVEPLLLTELVFDGFFLREDEDTIAAILAAVDYDARHDDACFGLPHVGAAREVERIARRLRACGATVRFDPVVSPLVYAWSRGAPFPSLMRHTTIQDGDFVGAVRRAVDLLRQLRLACRGDAALVEKFRRCAGRLDRDEVQVLF
jgi:superfamily II RNA helicase